MVKNMIGEQSKVYEDVMWESPYPIIIEQNKLIVFANKASLSLLEISDLKDVYNKPLIHFIHPNYHYHINTSNKESNMQIWTTSTGKTIPLLVKQMTTQFNGSKASHIVLVEQPNENTTKDYFAESLRRYHYILSNINDSIAIILEETIQYVNQSFVHLVEAKSSGEVVGQSIYKFIRKDDNKLVDTQQSHIQSEPFEWILVSLGDKEIIVEALELPTTFRDQAAKLIIIRDITNQKKTEELALRSEKLAVVGQLAAGIAHEIRNPLTALKGFLQLFKSDVVKKEDYIKIMNEEIDRIELISGELLSLSKPQSSMFSKEDMNDVIADVISLMDSEAFKRGIQIKPFFHIDPLFIFGVRNQLKQVFINVIKNAIEGMGDGGFIEVHCKSCENEVVVEVKDEGCGIHEHEFNRLGQPFYTTKEKGTGLGLMVTFGIIDNHRGNVEISSKINVGTTFTVKFPSLSSIDL